MSDEKVAEREELDLRYKRYLEERTQEEQLFGRRLTVAGLAAGMIGANIDDTASMEKMEKMFNAAADFIYRWIYQEEP